MAWDPGCDIPAADPRSSPGRSGGGDWRGASTLPGLRGCRRRGGQGLRGSPLSQPGAGVVQPESRGRDPLSPGTSVDRKPPGLSRLHSRGAASSSETLKDAAAAGLARDTGRSFICHLSLPICTLVTHLLPQGAFQAFCGLLCPTEILAHTGGKENGGDGEGEML